MRYLLLLPLLVTFLSCNRQATRLEQTGGGPVTATAPMPTTDDNAPRNRNEELRMEDSPDLRATIEETPASPDVDRPQTSKVSPMNPNWEKRKREQQKGQTPQTMPEKNAAGTQVQNPIPDADVKALQAPVLFRLRKTPCYGDCPVYSMTLLESEMAILDATKGTVKAGKQVQKLGHFDYTDLVTQFRQVAGMELADRYPVEGNVPVDLPFTELTFTDEEGKERVIEVYGSAPEPLADFITSLEEIATGYGWK